MTPQDIVHEIARAAVLTDIADMPGLVGLQDQLATLAGDLIAHPAIARECTECCQRIDQIINAEIADAEEILAAVRNMITDLQQHLNGTPKAD
ncbi:MAG: hypothetical protein AAF432_07655 [Planctomycetota bacterium]